MFQDSCLDSFGIKPYRKTPLNGSKNRKASQHLIQLFETFWKVLPTSVKIIVQREENGDENLHKALPYTIFSKVNAVV